jgi:hypothetical protein
MAKFDETTDSWSVVATFPGLNIYYPAGFSINGIAYLGVGELFPRNEFSGFAYDFWSFVPF